MAPRDPDAPAGPASWLLENARHLGGGGRALDVACGTGRHALWLASAGFEVRAVDRDAAKLARLAAVAARLALPVTVEARDLEAGDVDLGEGAYRVVVVIHYLHRPLFPALCRALAPGGLLLYETFTVDQAARGRPSDPRFLLRHGELRRLVAGLEILAERDGVYEDRAVAGILARRAR